LAEFCGAGQQERVYKKLFIHVVIVLMVCLHLGVFENSARYDNFTRVGWLTSGQLVTR